MLRTKRAVEGGNAVPRRQAEWTHEGRTKGRRRVVPDGNFARYQGSMYFIRTWKKRARRANPGGTAEAIKLLSQ